MGFWELPFSRLSGFARALVTIKFLIGSDSFLRSIRRDKLFKSLSSHAHFTHLSLIQLVANGGLLLETAKVATTQEKLAGDLNYAKRHRSCELCFEPCTSQRPPICSHVMGQVNCLASKQRQWRHVFSETMLQFCGTFEANEVAYVLRSFGPFFTCLWRRENRSNSADLLLFQEVGAGRDERFIRYKAFSFNWWLDVWKGNHRLSCQAKYSMCIQATMGQMDDGQSHHYTLAQAV